MSNENLSFSPQGLMLLKRDEGVVEGLYDDASNFCTSGVGHLVHTKDKWASFLLAAASSNAIWKRLIAASGRTRYPASGNGVQRGLREDQRRRDRSLSSPGARCSGNATGGAMRLARTVGVVLALIGCAPGTPTASPPPVSADQSNDTKTAAPPTVTKPSMATDPCAAERTTLAMESCVGDHLRSVEAEIQAALRRFTGVAVARGGGDVAALVAASQSDWESYRSSQCQLFEKLSEGGSIARVAVAYCRLDLAQARLANLRSLEQSIVD
jgi:uncharacterized protein YecT (DUF1311 family)